MDIDLPEFVLLALFLFGIVFIGIHYRGKRRKS
jgi:hypothetical protein